MVNIANLERQSGVFLHISSLPSKFGIGDLGPASYSFIDFLEKANQKLWQILPLGPTGFDHSPYKSFSSYAGNPLFISVDSLIDEGYIKKNQINHFRGFSSKTINYEHVIPFKQEILKKAYKYFLSNFADFQKPYEDFHNENPWLNDYALFIALKKSHDLFPWFEWAEQYKNRDSESLERFAQIHKDAIQQVKFNQFIFFQQWFKLKKYANDRGIQIIGDLPHFVAHDSTDVLIYPAKFTLDQKGFTQFVAGVPPDFFSKTGQKWGYPLYHWENFISDNFDWWKSRIKHNLKMYDIIKLNHFLGFTRYWEIPANEPTAIYGIWRKSPGQSLFSSIRSRVQDHIVIADDLGEFSVEANELKDQLNFLGMAVFQFAFSSDQNVTDNHLPKNYSPNIVGYSSTHDLNSLTSWYDNLSTEKKKRIKSYLGTNQDIPKAIIANLFESDAKMIIIPLPDLLTTVKNARMNQPGRTTGNWQWRFQSNALEESIVDFLGNLSKSTNRN